MLGYPDDQPPAPDDNVWERHIHPEDAARVMRGIRQYLQARRTPRAESPAPDATADNIYEATYRLCRLDGSIIWVVAKGRRSSDVSGRRSRFNGIMFDVTAQKRAEQALRQAQEDLIQAEKMAVARLAGRRRRARDQHAARQYADGLVASLRQGRRACRRCWKRTGYGAATWWPSSALLTETTRLMVTNCERAAELVQSFKQVAVDQTSGERRSST